MKVLTFFSKRWHDEVETVWWNLKLVGACDDPRIKIIFWSGLLLVHVYSPFCWSVASHRGNPSDDPRIKKRPLCASQPFFWFWFKALLKWSMCVWCWFAFPMLLLLIFLLRKVLDFLPIFYVRCVAEDCCFYSFLKTAITIFKHPFWIHVVTEDSSIC